MTTDSLALRGTRWGLFCSLALWAIIIAILLSLLSCGQETIPNPVNISGVNIVSEGPLESQPEIMRWTFEDVKACARHFGLPVREGYPNIIIVDGPITCGTYTEISACGCGDNIYFIRTDTLMDPFMNDTQAHEYFHFITGLNNDHHQDTAFIFCQSPALRGKWTEE